MRASNDPARAGAAASPAFASTLWNIVLEAREGQGSRAEAAMARLCETYWYPLYAFVRRSGYSPHDAEDLTQGFFLRLLEPCFLKGVRPEKGRFRSYLLACLKHFMANEWKRGRRQRRGGDPHFVPIDLAETRYASEPASDSTPDLLFERRWALSLLDNALARLRAEQLIAEKAALFEKLKPYLVGDHLPPSQAELAVNLGLSTPALKMAISRLRRRYRDILRGLIAETVGEGENVDDEIRHLLASLR